ncbi:hypothetical protein [Mesorhizobium sangaii]|uniref:Uncharacterized protein n=1 Tax=Mesorhizobium sangaii TaxID=505389 RepID=A0A841PJ98_9HYPH|nr:hypothetical protein [Mesorhizobium sangaii]MBB6414071.1 hypothetical protein [Mesorhizobium sangaii]
MARKVFFAAFVIDEEAYTPEPGPVDHHFVAADLAQSSFGEQSGVSNIILWNSAEDLIADHQQRGPITVAYLRDDEAEHGASFTHGPENCPASHWNRGDDICADCGANLNKLQAKPATPLTDRCPSFRDHLTPTMRNTLTFEYFEVRPCIERDRQVTSYRDEDEFAADLARAQRAGREFRAFWSLYGVDQNSTTAIGDFVSKNAAREVLNAILAVPAAARNALHAENSARRRTGAGLEVARYSVADWLDDMINQSSNNQPI